jgi:hypothetical protein
MTLPKRNPAASGERKTVLPHIKVPADVRTLYCQAKRYAALGDRWFVSMGRAILRSTDGVGAEAEVVKESAGRAANTTMLVGRRVVESVSKRAVTIRIARPGAGGSTPTVNEAVKRVTDIIQAYGSVIESMPHEFIDEVCARIVATLETGVAEALEEPDEAAVGAGGGETFAGEPDAVTALLGRADDTDGV